MCSHLLFPPALTLISLFLFSFMIYKNPKTFFTFCFIFLFGSFSYFLGMIPQKNFPRIMKKGTIQEKVKTTSTSSKGKEPTIKEVIKGIEV